MTKFSEAVKSVIIRKDGFFPSKPWNADLILADDTVWKSWQYNFSTKKALMQTIKSYIGSANIPVLS
jgi:hypothetical protein